MISVVIPLYNKAHTIERTLRSVMGQTYQNFEVIVIDDGSSDNGSELVDALKDDRIRLIRRPNGGVSRARNIGMAEAKGGFIAFLDADDVWSPAHLLDLVKLKDDFPDGDVFGTGYALAFADGRRTEMATSVARGYIVYFREFGRTGSPVLTSSSIMITKTAISRVGYFDEGIANGEDLLYWARLALRCKVVFEPQVSMQYYVETAGNVMMTTSSVRKLSKSKYIISPSVDFLEQELAAAKVPKELVGSVVLYNQSTIMRAVKGSLYQRDPKRARNLLLTRWSRQHFVLKALFYLALSFLPAPVWQRLLKLWNKRHFYLARLKKQST